MKKTITIKYKPNSNHQKLFHDSEAYERLLITGLGGGKTLAGCAEILKLSAINYGLQSLIVGLNYQVLKRTVVPTLINLLNESSIEYTYNKSEHSIYIEDFDHTIYLASAEIPTSLKGSNVSSLYIDESASISEEAYTQAIGRVRDPKSKRLSITHTSTPELNSWLYNHFFKQSSDDKEVIQGSTYDNKALPQSYIKSLESRYSKELREMYLEGKFILSLGKVIKPSWFKQFDLRNKEDWIINYSIDTAYGKEKSDNTGILEYSILEDKLYLWGYYEVNLEFPELVKYINNLAKSNSRRWKSGKVTIEPKASGLSIIQMMQRYSDLNVVEGRVPTESKFSRVVAYTGILESGKVLIHDEFDWENFLFQCSQFTRDELYNDEAVDCLVMAMQDRESYGFNFEDLIL